MPLPATLPPDLVSYWQAFCRAMGGVDDERFYEVCVFGDSEALADELAALVLRGVKRATASAVWTYAAEGRRPPAPGDLSLVTNWRGEAQGVIETQAVELLPFHAVSAEFAAREGEGDGSLAYWRAAHRDYFERECARAGRRFDEEMLVACERFELIYPRP